jgi:hypothetical protein
MNKIIIADSKGIAVKTTNSHEYILPGIGRVLVKTKKIKETFAHTEGKEIPINVEEEKISTYFGIERTETLELLFSQTVEREASDEDALASFGYYLADYDEMLEAYRMRRIIDLAKFVEI